MSANYLEDTKYDNIDIPQGNPLISASKYFGTIEGRIFYLAVMELNPRYRNSKVYDSEFKDIVIPTNVLMKVLGGRPNLYSRVVTVANELLMKTVEVETELGDGTKEWVGYTIFSKMKFTPETGLIIKFNNDMLHLLLELHVIPYTNINSRIVFALQSGYAIRLIELMLQYKNLPSMKKDKKIVRVFNIKDLRILFKAKKSYKLTSDFIKNCVVSPVAEINNSTNYHINYKILRKKHRIDSIEFTMILPEDFAKQESHMATLEETIATVECKETAKIIKKANEFLPPENTSPEPLSAEDELVDRLKVKGILKGTSRKWLKEFGYDKLAWVEKYVDEKAKKGTVQKYGAYYRRIIESNEYENALAENARIEAEREKRSQTIAIQMAQHKEEMERENIETNQIIENGFYSLSIDALQSFVRIYQNHLDKLAAEPEINEEAIGRTLATLDKYKNRIREIQKKELEAEYGTDIQEEFSSQASAEIPPSNTQQQMDFNALLNGLVNAKRVF